MTTFRQFVPKATQLISNASASGTLFTVPTGEIALVKVQRIVCTAGEEVKIGEARFRELSSSTTGEYGPAGTSFTSLFGGDALIQTGEILLETGQTINVVGGTPEVHVHITRYNKPS